MPPCTIRTLLESILIYISTARYNSLTLNELFLPFNLFSGCSILLTYLFLHSEAMELHYKYPHNPNSTTAFVQALRLFHLRTSF